MILTCGRARREHVRSEMGWGEQLKREAADLLPLVLHPTVLEPDLQKGAW